MNTQKVAISMPEDLISVGKSSLVEKIGSLPRKKMEQVVAGLKLVMDIP